MLEMLDIMDDRWLEFLQHHDQANIFHAPAWSIMLKHAYLFQPYALADITSDGKVSAGLPIIEKISPLGKRSWVSLPFTDHCAPLSLDPDGMRHFSTKLDHFIKKDLEKGVEIRWHFPGMDSLLPKQDFVLHNLTLFEDFDTNLKLIQPGSNRNARAARKHGLRIEMGKDLQHLKDFYHLHLMTRRKQGVPIQPFSFFNRIMYDILDKDLGFVMAAYQGSKCLASALFLTWNKIITYKYGASDPDGLSLRPNDLIFQEIIRYGCEHRFANLDFGRTDMGNNGLRRYKSGWGAIESPLIYSYAPTLPTIRPTWMMSTLGSLIKNSPSWVCRLVGEILYRYAG